MGGQVSEQPEDAWDLLAARYETGRAGSLWVSNDRESSWGINGRESVRAYRYGEVSDAARRERRRRNEARRRQPSRCP